jgi:hypothetical protein
MLTGVPTINQAEFKTLIHFGIRSGKNILVLGPSGGGKTLMANQACQEEGCRMVYINLSVLERTDFQGFPVPSEDGKRTRYATPSYLEFKDSVTHDAKTALGNLVSLVGDEMGEELKDKISAKIKSLEKRDNAQALVEASPYLDTIFDNKNKEAAKDKDVAKAKESLKLLINSYKDILEEDEPIVFLFDEADKASTETCQTLLELLQFHSINGRKLNIKACILTGNLPDEHAHVNNISHAITKRCLTFRLDIDFKLWRSWAFENNVNLSIVQFLSAESSFLYKSAPDNDPTAYALPSPRTWVEAGSTIDHLQSDKMFLGMSEDVQADLMYKIVSGSVGDLAGTKFKAWYIHYRKFDPVVNELVDNGKHPDLSNLSASDILVLALSACNRVYQEVKPNNKKKMEKIIKNVYPWIASIPEDHQIGAVRLSFGGDWEKITKYGLVEIPEFYEVFEKITKKLEKF